MSANKLCPICKMGLLTTDPMQAPICQNQRCPMYKRPILNPLTEEEQPPQVHFCPICGQTVTHDSPTTAHCINHRCPNFGIAFQVIMESSEELAVTADPADNSLLQVYDRKINACLSNLTDLDIQLELSRDFTIQMELIKVESKRLELTQRLLHQNNRINSQSKQVLGGELCKAAAELSMYSERMLNINRQLALWEEMRR